MLRTSAFVEFLEIRRLLATFGSIQAAVDGAAPGSILTVGAGTVQELVTVNKPLTIRGARFGIDAADSSRGQGETIIRGGAVSDGTRSTSFLITANDVTIDGFTVQDDSSSNLYGAGIVISPGVHGTHIINNIVQSNIAGLILANNSTTDPALIQHNVFKNNNNQGTNSGRGIYSDSRVSGGNLTNVVIDSNTFTGNVGFGPPAEPRAAIDLKATKHGRQSNITITNNTMQGNGKGVLLANASNVSIAGNAMTASTDTHGAAIRIEGGSSRISIFRNAIAFNLGAAIRISTELGKANSKFTITQNNLYGNAGGALVVDKGSYKKTLDATNNWWGSDQGPGGDGPGVGDALFANGAHVIFAPWATAPIGSTPTNSSTPRGLRGIVIADLATVRAQVPPKLQALIDDATAALNASLAGSLWVDDSNLAAGAGRTVFDLDGKAVKRLWQLIKAFKKSSLPSGLVETIGRVIDLERIMAMIAIDAAPTVSAKALSHANGELSAGADLAARGKFADAILHFRRAWQLAIDQQTPPKKPKHAKGDEQKDKPDKGDGGDHEERVN